MFNQTAVTEGRKSGWVAKKLKNLKGFDPKAEFSVTKSIRHGQWSNIYGERKVARFCG